MAIKLVKGINILNREWVETVDSEQHSPQSAERFYLAENYNGTINSYLEVVSGSQSPGYNGRCYIWDDGVVTDRYVIFGDATYTRYRSAPLSIFTGEVTLSIYNTKIPSTYTWSIRAARLLIFQDAGSALTATESQIEIGSYQEILQLSTPAALTYPKFWTYTSANWDGTCAFYAEVVYQCSSTKGALYAYLQEDDGSFANWGSAGGNNQVTIVNGSTATDVTRTRVAFGFTPVDGRHYRLAVYTGSSKYAPFVYCGKIVVTQTGTITKTECTFLLAQTTWTGALGNFDQYYTPDDWSDITVDLYHEVSLSYATTVKLQSDPNGTPADIPNSSIYSTDLYRLIRGGSAMTMPGTAKEIDCHQANNSAVYLSRMVAIVVVSAEVPLTNEVMMVMSNMG